MFDIREASIKENHLSYISSIRLIALKSYNTCFFNNRLCSVMALHSTVRLPYSVLDLGTVKRPLMACVVGYAWVSAVC